MVTRPYAAGVAFVLIVGIVSASAVTNYRLGDILTNDVVTPVTLVVIDQEATAKWRRQEAEKVPPIIRHDPRAADEAVRALENRVAIARSYFLNEVILTFGTYPLPAEALQSPRYRDLLKRFPHLQYGVSNLEGMLDSWALDTKSRVPGEWVQQVRQGMANLLVSHAILPKLWGGEVAQVVPVSALEVPPDLKDLQANAHTVPLSRITEITTFRRVFQQQFPEDKQDTGRFLSSFLQVNASLDVQLTEMVRSVHVAPLVISRTVPAGTMILQRGEIIDHQALAVLDELRRAQGASQPILGQVLPSQKWFQSLTNGTQGLLTLSVGGTFVILGLLVLVGRRVRRLSQRMFAPDLGKVGRYPALPEFASSRVVAPDSEFGDSDSIRLSRQEEEWMRRALVAEERAEKVQALARAGLTPRLRRLLKEKMVQQLASQRQELIHDQVSATQHAGDLETRLGQVHGPLRERLAAYEERIAELESELAIKDEENRILIRTRIEAIQQQMGEDRSREDAFLN